MKKNLDDLSFHFRKRIRVNWLAIKLLTFFVFAGTITLSASTYSQKTKIDLHMRNSSLADIFSSIEKSSEFIFFYNEEVVNDQIVKSVSVEGEKIEEILEQLFAGTDIAYKIDDHQVFLYKKDNLKQLEQLKMEIKIEQPQKKQLNGKVTDIKGEPIPGTTIFVKGATVGVVSNSNGEFILNVPFDSKVLSFSFVGFKAQEIPIGNKTYFAITLEEETVGLEEVVAIGYGVQKKIAISGAISSVSSADIIQSPASNVASSLAGRVTGFAAVQLGGKPGDDDPVLFIRGIASLTQASSTPLILVDGVEREFNRLDPNEIESISILKDASSTAVYGVRGANGVVLVTTKRGKSGAPQINFTSNYGIQKPTNLIKFIDSYTYATTYNESQLNDNPNGSVRFSPEAIEAFRTNSDPILYPNTDWMDYMLKPSSFNLQANINISGGNEKVRYFVSVGYRNEDGLWKKLYPWDATFWYKQYNLRANLDINLTKTTSISLTTNNIAGRQNQPYSSQADDAWFRAMYWSQPYSSPGIIDGRQIITGSHIPDQMKQGFNPDYGSGTRTTLKNNLNFDIGLVQKLDFITKGLGFRTKVAYNYAMAQTKNRTINVARWYADPLYVYVPDAPAETRNTVVYRKQGDDRILGYSESNTSGMNWYMETAFDYNRSFGNHNLAGLIMYNQSKAYYPSVYPDIPSGYLGFVGRLTYNYRSKYFIDFNAGYNGSENFVKGRRFGFFPAVSGGWIVSDENFMKKIPVISHLKLRGSYGFVGNDKIGGSRFLFLPDTYNGSAGGYNFGTSVPQNQITAGESTIGNPLVTWEKSRKQNIGVDLKFFKGNLGISFDQFYEYRSDILITRNTTPAFIPVKLPPVNLGKVSNRGYEVEVEWRKNKKEFGYFISVNLSKAKNKILFNDELPQAEPYLATTGRSVSQTFGYIFDGFWSENDITNVSDFPTHWYTPHAGDIRYKDLNNDGVVNANDQKAIGYPINPEITGGTKLGMNYKNFDFFVMFSGATRTSRLLGGSLQIPFSSLFRNTAQWLVDGRWTPETAETATLPRFSLNGLGYNYATTSDIWMRDASYVRLKNAEIGYSLSNINRFSISKIRVYVNGYNLLTFSKLKITDPESQTGDRQLYPLMQMINFGLNITFK
ncbi:MAG: TonB-dependent receptor [Prolixibacteraceae bacterium]|jgi:TonB-linked SusC/RagA family outer membrane protein|nr:TonB-dependent receptor [Prolixibacteraceae bacterium]